MPGTPLRVCYVLSHFHPVASGAERQALAQGAELVRRGHSVHVVTRHVRGHAGRRDGRKGCTSIDGSGPRRSGPLFGLSFVAGVIAGPAAAPAANTT